MGKERNGLNEVKTHAPQSTELKSFYRPVSKLIWKETRHETCHLTEISKNVVTKSYIINNLKIFKNTNIYNNNSTYSPKLFYFIFSQFTQ